MILRNGIDIPDIGFGTWNIPYGEVCERAVFEAIKAGYRHIDTAGAYGNERSVGLGVKAALSEALIEKRSDIFITSKLWNTNRSYNKAFRGFDKSMRNLDLDYIDLYLIHWPANKVRYKNPDEVNAVTWQALEELYEEGRAKSIGVSNFLPHHIEELKKSAKVLPMVNQIELHVGYMQEEVVEYNKKNAQLIFTTHNLLLLDYNLFREDQIWFLENNDVATGTELYSLSDIEGYEKNSYLLRDYLNGNFGGIPKLKEFGIDLWLGKRE